VLQGFRSWGFTTNIVFLPLVAYLIMNHPDYSSMAHNVSEKLSLINNEQIRDQMLTPITMTLYIPIGLMGAFAAVMFLADIGSNDVYLHSWGSILVQDVILPLRKTPLSSKQHMIYLRASIVFVAIFIFFFSFLFRQTQHILYFFAITGAIWLGGAGAVIVGGLYTRWGNARGAFAALISGSTVAVTGIICEQSWAAWYGPGQKFFLTGQEVYFVAIVVASTLYIAFSLLGKRTPFDLDRMLHRKEHAGESARNTAEIPAAKIKRNFKGLIGITDEFTLGDKLIYFFSTAQTAIFFVLFVTMTLFAIFYDLSDKSWVKYHYYVFFFSIIASVVIAIWLGIFGLRDMIRLFADLKAMKRDAADNGRVECQSAPEKVPHDSQPVTPVN
jgi:SSS family solute:Na+ symporter